MNEDEFGKRLKELVRPLAVNDPTQAWKGEMLNKAKAGRDARANRPRLMVAMLAVAWVVIGLMKVTMPEAPVVNAGGLAEGKKEEKVSPSQQVSAYALFAARGQLQAFEF